MKIAVQIDSRNRRANAIGQAFATGLKRHDLQPVIVAPGDPVSGDLIVAYGWIHRDTFRAYRQFVFWDLGYWGRRIEGKLAHEGFHRFAINSWDTAFRMPENCPGDRLAALGVEPVEYRPLTGSKVLLAGMSVKAAWTHGFMSGAWERQMLERLREMSGGKYEIVYRPKPTKKVPAAMPLSQVFTDTRLVVTHHSNTAIEALVEDIPVYAEKGIPSLASGELDIENPFRLSYVERRQLLRNTAYCQYSVDEMRSGRAWEGIKWNLNSY